MAWLIRYPFSGFFKNAVNHSNLSLCDTNNWKESLANVTEVANRVYPQYIQISISGEPQGIAHLALKLQIGTFYNSYGIS
jgi:hypothetical protein